VYVTVIVFRTAEVSTNLFISYASARSYGQIEASSSTGTKTALRFRNNQSPSVHPDSPPQKKACGNRSSHELAKVA
jgi:hypothetical protein